MVSFQDIILYSGENQAQIFKHLLKYLIFALFNILIDVLKGGCELIDEEEVKDSKTADVL